MKTPALVLTFVACVVAGFLSYQALNSEGKSSEKDLKAQYLQGGDFRLLGAQGELSLSQFKGSPVVLYFGFTHCPDVCPLGLTVVRDALKADNDFQDVPAIFVTLDPERDTPERLSSYLSFFHPNLRGASGSVAQIKEVAKRYGTYFAKTGIEQNGDYSVDHTAYYYLIDAQGELVRVLDHNTDARALASELKKLI